MIRFFLLQNRQGKTRLSKWYVAPADESEKVRLEDEIHRLVVSRDRKYTSFIEFLNYKLVYRRYAGLFFTIAVDINDNELACLETIHLFVELLDQYFSNVCELDIVFNFNKVRSPALPRTLPVFGPNSPSTHTAPQVYSILDEYILAGEIQETSKKEILDRIKEMEKREKD
mmetsp:Transcript_24025/g.65006  ORF Transcript_24025/g.65006 Transcript_24025/m.65006 type:complete len:171 (-) Transcript_24025:102-614(-)